MDKEFAIDGNAELEALVDNANGNGGHVVLTRDGKQVGSLTVNEVFDPEAARAAMEWIIKQPKIDLGGMTIKELINEGRKY